ncbi:MAG TPA: pyridoxine 5'-phosphate synthase [Phycisphaerales bacterium]|nr:pyridoxine 5'-phosphate synthase [Phycisphaerales bacterium]
MAPLLGVNIDHIATIRQARYRAGAGAGLLIGAEPDPVRAAHEAELGGADILTVHLREDRRHIQDRDVELLREVARVRINLEMGATDEMVGIAARLKPQMSTLVPEGRQEVTTEGGLEVAGQAARMKGVVAKLKASGIVCSAFINADEGQIKASREAGFDACEIHTGPYAEAFARAGGDFSRAELSREFEKVKRAGELIRSLGMRFHAGHGLNYVNVGPIARLEGITELHIGHSIVSRAVFAGMRSAVAAMKHAIG